jgi:dephospho-CoA kinase
VGRIVIGILGGIGSGKSTVARYFKSLGAKVIDADDIAHRLLLRREIKRNLERSFGERILSGGKVDRKALAELCFSDGRQRKRLENILHPLIKEKISKEVKRLKNGLIIIDAPLLVEKGSADLCQKFIFVEVSKKLRRKRLTNVRGWNLGELQRREAHQLSLAKKKKLADYIIDNRGSLSSTFAQVKRVYNRLMQDLLNRR